jgi:hypothetical protein
MISHSLRARSEEQDSSTLSSSHASNATKSISDVNQETRFCREELVCSEGGQHKSREDKGRDGQTPIHEMTLQTNPQEWRVGSGFGGRPCSVSNSA